MSVRNKHESINQRADDLTSASRKYLQESSRYELEKYETNATQQRQKRQTSIGR